MINKANDVYNQWLNAQETPIVKHGEEVEGAGKNETLSGSTTTNGQVRISGNLLQSAIHRPRKHKPYQYQIRLRVPISR
jgi:hypothetical protein